MDSIQLGNKQHISYLRARDPSILTGNRRTVLINLRMNLAEEIKEEEDTTISEIDEPTLQNIQVYLRVKKVDRLDSAYELDNNTLRCFVPEGSHGSRNLKDGHCLERTYTFSHIFGPLASQEDIFNRTVKPKLLDLINGTNFTLMTYGASGSGKTYTIVGTASEPGVVPRALEYLFGSLPKLPDRPSVKPTRTDAVIVLDAISSESEKNARNMLLNTLNATIDRQHVKTYEAMQHRLSSEPVAELEGYTDVSVGVWVSFAEIYNENVYDLLSPEPKGKTRTKLQLGKTGDKSYVKNLKHISVCSGLEAYQVLQYGLHNLNYAATGINSHSSRSHCIFTIKLVQAVAGSDDKYHVSYFNFCDLAGSERLKKTLNIGERLKESNNINTSLLVLGRCISLIRDSQQKNDANKIIPFRDSKLTMLFQKALSGREETTMIVNMSPIYEMFDESMHVLNFSAIAKQITVKRAQTKIVKPKKESLPVAAAADIEEVQKLKELVADLYDEIEQQRLQFEENERLVRDQNVASFRAFVADNDRRWETKMRLREEQFKDELERAVEDIKEKYEDMMEQQPKKRIKVINLDSSSSSIEDEEDRFLRMEKAMKAQIQDLNLSVNNLQAELTKCRFDHQVEQQKLNEEISRLTEKCESLEAIKDDMLVENIVLKEANSELRLILTAQSNQEDADEC